MEDTEAIKLDPVMKLLFKELHSKLDRIETNGIETKQQVMKTNGRVTRLEKWQYAIVMCGSLFTGLVLPLIVYSYFVSQQNLKYEILNGTALTSAVDAAVERNYKIQNPN